MSLGGTDTITISFQELIQTKRFLENQPKLSKPSTPDLRCENVLNEDTKRSLITPNKPRDNLSNRNASSGGEKSHTYPSNHGMLRIPKEVDAILRGDSRPGIKASSTRDEWERFRVCGNKLGEIVRRNSGPLMRGITHRASELSREMRELAAVIIQSEIEFCAEHSVETELWQKGIYSLIEPFRENAKKYPESRREYLSFLQTTEQFYTSLISSVQSSYAFSLCIVDTIRNVDSRDRQEKVKKAVLSCHFAYLALGDILRYQMIGKEFTAEPNLCVEYDWSMVESHYLNAMHLAPEKGRSYNQLAIVSSNQVRYLDTVYYYIRCLTAVSPIPSVRESLIQIFHSIDKKNLDSLKKEEKNKSKIQKFQIENEVWIIPESLMKPVTLSTHPPEYFNSQLVARKTISPGTLNKIYKEVYLSFLIIQSKYFTSIGIDTVSDWVARFDSAFSSLMKSRSNQSLAEILLKMQLIVIFSLTNNTASKSAQQSKLGFFFTFHSAIFQSLLVQLQTENPNSAWFLLPHIRIFVQWLRHYRDSWQDSIDTFTKHRIWSNLFLVLNHLIQHRGDKAPLSPTFLWEDQFLTGCTLLDRFIHSRMSWKCLQIDPQDEVSRELRISVTLNEMETICTQSDIPIRYHGDTFTLESDLEKDTETELSPKSLTSENDFIEDNTFDESEFISDDEILCDQSEDVNQRDYIYLKTEKERLRAEVNKQTSELKNTHSIISNKLNKGAFQRHEISPRYIVPDTNCYLSSLNLIQRLYSDSNLQLTLPLIVLQELEQLRIPYSSSPKHKSSSLKAQEAYSWLMREFTRSDSRLLALTIQGNLVSNPSYQQDFSSVRNQRNDDLILQACVKLNSQKEEECLKSSVVLVTSDRNLRLKAQSFFLPAKSLTRFLCILDIKF